MKQLTKEEMDNMSIGETAIYMCKLLGLLSITIAGMFGVAWLTIQMWGFAFGGV